MCGIAGIAGDFTEAQGKALVMKMLKEIQHRGPDSNGVWSDNHFAFGMQRLSIIDLAGGDQPMWSTDGVGIVFNGEIYNFKSLRENLEKQGIVFKTKSDTEVLLQLYIQKGLTAIHDLEGMFGICLYDPRLQKVILIRDRLGVKPLYYYKDSAQFIFASEIKSILQALPERPKLNEQSLWDYLTLRYVPAPETIWDNIYKIQPGHYLEYDLQKNIIDIRKYWSVDFHSQKNSKTRNYEKEFSTLFLEAVEKRLLASDVPVGILLSGGLDSSCVAAAAVELGHRNFHTFSVGFAEGGEFNELNYARQVAKHIGSTHHEIIINDKNFIDFIHEFVWFSDEPLADLASIPLYYVSKLARQHVKVVLSGEGADETLAGYNLDEFAKKLSILKLAQYIPKCLLKFSKKQSIQILAKHGYHNFLKSKPCYITSVFSEEEKKKLCLFNGEQSTFEKIREWYSLTPSEEPLDQLQQAYCHSWLVEDLLMKADKMSMATSLELRVPFLDHRLVDWVAKLPHQWKVGNHYSGFSTKKILRHFARKRLPKEIIERPKQGFPVPAYQWLKKDLKDWANEELQGSHLLSYFTKSEIEKTWCSAQAGSMKSLHQIWNIIIFSQWLKRWAI